MGEADGLKAQHMGSGDVNGTAAEVLLLQDAEGHSLKLFVDASTYLPLKQVYQGTNMMGTPAEMEEFYLEIKDIEGVKLPGKIVINADGKKFLETVMNEIKLNQEIDPKLFEKE
jgi:hypothetical protein